MADEKTIKINASFDEGGDAITPDSSAQERADSAAKIIEEALKPFVASTQPIAEPEGKRGPGRPPKDPEPEPKEAKSKFKFLNDLHSRS